MAEDFLPVLILGILISVGFLLGLLVERLNIPRIVGYIIVGALFSEDLLGGLLELSVEEWSPQITDIALGIIAYLIGAEINIDELKKQRSTVIDAVIGQSAATFLFVAAGLWGAGQLLTFIPEINIFESFIFGSLAVASAPATTLGIIDEYNARGHLTNILLGVIAIADAVCIIFFTISISLGGEGSVTTNLLHGAKEIFGALALGGALGYLLGLLAKRIKKEELRLAMIIGFIFLGFGLSNHLGLSELLCCMAIGFVSKSFRDVKRAEWLIPMRHIEELVFLLFFTLAGAHFQFSILISTFGFVILYTLLRSAGKFGGAYGGMTLTNTPEKTKKLLGLCLFPQAGVAIGLAMRAANQPGFEEIGSLIVNIILGSTIIFELTSPIITYYALKKAGNIE